MAYNKKYTIFGAKPPIPVPKLNNFISKGEILLAIPAPLDYIVLLKNPLKVSKIVDMSILRV